jgi:hypothetical protein
MCRSLGVHLPVTLVLILVGSLACKEPSAPAAEPPDETTPPSEAATSPESSPPEAPEERELTPTAVCDHAAAMVAEYLELHPGQELRVQSRDDCIAGANDDLARLGPEKFRVRAECMMAATTPAALKACERQADRELEVLCEHLFPLLFHPPDAPPLERVPPEHLAVCVSEMAKERERLAPEEFNAMRECMLRATTADRVTACGPE